MLYYHRKHKCYYVSVFKRPLPFETTKTIPKYCNTKTTYVNNVRDKKGPKYIRNGSRGFFCYKHVFTFWDVRCLKCVLSKTFTHSQALSRKSTQILSDKYWHNPFMSVKELRIKALKGQDCPTSNSDENRLIPLAQWNLPKSSFVVI